MCRLLVLVLGIAGAGGGRCAVSVGAARFGFWLLAFGFWLGFFLTRGRIYVAGDRKDMAGNRRYNFNFDILAGRE